MLTESFEYTITKLPNGMLQVRQERVIKDGNTEISRLFHRYVEEPDKDASTITVPEVKQIAEAVWTPVVKTAYLEEKAKREAQTAKELGINVK